MKYFSLLVLTILMTIPCLGQDTLFYNKAHTSAYYVIKGNYLMKFNNIEGKNLLDSARSFTYCYSDTILQSVKCFNVVRSHFKEIYEINPGNPDLDTVYFYFKGMLEENDIMKYYKRFQKKIKKDFRYPKKARKNQIEARMMFKFIVNKKGKIVYFENISKNTYGYGIEEEIRRIMSNLGYYGKIIKNGLPVNVYFRIPIRLAVE